MKNFLILLLASLPLITVSQNNTIASGETLKFTAAYNMSGIMTDIAEVTMQTSSIKTSKATLMRLKCTAATYSKWDNFFKIRDLYESYVSPKSLTPYLYKRDIDEGGYYKFMQYKFSHSKGLVSSIMKKRRSNGTIWEEKKNVSIGSGTKDLVSTLYKLRTLDFSTMSNGSSKSFTVIFDNKSYIVNFKYLGKETINTNIGRKECYKLSISINNSDVLKGAHNNLLWLTADGNKIPVYAKFKIPVGNGELKIKSATGLKY